MRPAPAPPHPTFTLPHSLRSPQLAVYSIAFYLPVALNEGDSLFDGWTVNAAMLAVLGSAGGILVALTMKYTDAVLKTFATSGAIILCAVAGHILLEAPLDIPIGVGAGCTVLSLLNYSDNGDPPPAVELHGKDSEAPTASARARSIVGAKTESGAYHEDEARESLINRVSSPRESAA